MFHPVSDISYLTGDPDAQVLVCSLALSKSRPELLSKWQGRAAAFFEFTDASKFSALVRDLLANPQVRALVIDGDGDRAVFDGFWRGTDALAIPGVAPHHIELVRHYVTLFDDDCGILRPLRPYWPHRLRYTEDTK